MTNTSDKERIEKVTIEHKRWLRSEAKKVSGSLDERYIRESSDLIADKILSSGAYLNAGTIFCYMGVGREVGTDGIIQKVLRDGKRLCIPLCHGKGIMDAREYMSETELVTGACGIPEPTSDAKVIPVSEIDLAIIPCVACDRSCNRLGHGAGYYDRFLGESDITKVALCLDAVLADEIATDGYDVSMDAVVTEKEIYGDL